MPGLSTAQERPEPSPRTLARPHTPSPRARVIGLLPRSTAAQLLLTRPIASSQLPARVGMAVSLSASSGGQPAAFDLAGQARSVLDGATRRAFASHLLPISACQGGDAVPSFDEGFRTRFPGSRSDRLPQPLRDSYLPSLPRFYSSSTVPPVARAVSGSQLRCALLRSFSGRLRVSLRPFGLSP